MAAVQSEGFEPTSSPDACIFAERLAIDKFASDDTAGAPLCPKRRRLQSLGGSSRSGPLRFDGSESFLSSRAPRTVADRPLFNDWWNPGSFIFGDVRAIQAFEYGAHA